MDANAFLCRAGRMGRDDETAGHPTVASRYIWAIRERADQVTFWEGELLISRQGEARLYDWQVQESIHVTAHDEWQPQHVGQNGSGSVEAIKPQQCRRSGQVVCLQIRLDRFHRSAELLTVFTIAWVAKGAELCGIKTDMSRVIRLTHPFSPVFPDQPDALSGTHAKQKKERIWTATLRSGRLNTAYHWQGEFRTLAKLK
ncbi:MAG TPA: hypothetical protein VGF67_07085 [Ktedonobacteraceae bacterium]